MYLTITACVYLLEDSWKSQLLASLLFLLASYTRSNGLFNGLLVFGSILYRWTRSSLSSLCFSNVLLYLLPFFSCIFPYFIWNRLIFFLFCEYSAIDSVTLTSPTQLLCNQPIWFLSFAFLQETYWQVGFLKQFTWKQIPNFCLAFPIISIVLHYFYERYWQETFLIKKFLSSWHCIFELHLIVLFK
jgi:phosphatidylinositol glycan class V